MTLKYLGFSNNSDGGSFCMRITNIAGGRPDDIDIFRERCMDKKV